MNCFVTYSSFRTSIYACRKHVSLFMNDCITKYFVVDIGVPYSFALKLTRLKLDLSKLKSDLLGNSNVTYSQDCVIFIFCMDYNN